VNQLVVLVPVLGRPHRAAAAIEAFTSTLPGVRVCFVPDEDDLPEIEAIEAAGGEILCRLNANYATKINTAIRLTDEPLIFLGADDLIPKPGWFEAALAHMKDGIEVVGVNDLILRAGVRTTHATHFLMTRKYAELPTISDDPGPLCELYDHSCVDDELAGTAKHRHTYVYAEDAVVVHMHPDNGTAELDDTYRKARRHLRDDRRIWKSRRYWYLESRP
jgi:hypothetical protein